MPYDRSAHASVATMDALASQEEVLRAIGTLGQADYVKLVLIARHFARTRIGLSGVEIDIEAEDLLQEAISKTLDGRRKWNTTIPLLLHLDRVMESDSSHVVEQRQRFQQPQPAHGSEPIAARGDLLNDLIAKEETLDVFRLFGADQEALEVIRLRTIGFSASEIRQKHGLTSSQYETITKRIRRRLTTNA